jgi:histidine triad (HIT) family protein
VIEDRDSTFAFLNPRQFTEGAMLVIPKRHVPTVLELSDDEAAEVMRRVVRLARAVTRALNPAGLNIFQNNGLVSGQSIPHFHIHILPRRHEDGWDLGVSSAAFPVTPLEERLHTAERIRRHLHDA